MITVNFKTKYTTHLKMLRMQFGIFPDRKYWSNHPAVVFNTNTMYLNIVTTHKTLKKGMFPLSKEQMFTYGLMMDYPLLASFLFKELHNIKEMENAKNGTDGERIQWRLPFG